MDEHFEQGTKKVKIVQHAVLNNPQRLLQNVCLSAKIQLIWSWVSNTLNGLKYSTMAR